MQRLRHLFFSLLFSLASLGLAQTLTIAQGVDATTLDPNDQEETPTQNIVANIFDPLLWRDADGGIQPWLATSVEPVDDLNLGDHLARRRDFSQRRTAHR